MRNARTIFVPALFLIALVLALPLRSYAQNREKFVISARAGGVNAVTGRATMRPHGNAEWQQLTIKEDLETGDVVKTGIDGRIEMLLNPGSYMRIGENSEVELSDNSLDNLELRLIRGTAIVEVTGADDNELFIGITTPHTRMSIIRRGLYRVNVVPDDTTELIVRKGRVMLEGSHTKVKGGNKVVFSGSTFSVAKLEDNDKNRDTIESWSKDRAQTLAKANSKISEDALTTVYASFRHDWSYNGLWGRPFWLFNSASNCYTLVPFMFGWQSPYGAFYSRSIWDGYDSPYCCRRGSFENRTVFGRELPEGTPTRGSGGSVGSGPGFNPGSSSGRSIDSPMSGHGKPDLSPSGDGSGMRSPNRE
jgi:hypothetical protein